MEDNTTNNNVNIPRNAGKQKKKKQDPNIKKSIKFLNTNAQSLQYKISELAAKLNHEEIQIAGITESWGQEWNEAILSIKGYQDYRKNRIDGRRGGGCILYVNGKLKSQYGVGSNQERKPESLWDVSTEAHPAQQKTMNY